MSPVPSTKLFDWPNASLHGKPLPLEAYRTGILTSVTSYELQSNTEVRIAGRPTHCSSRCDKVKEV
jgi:hypothetical protein